MLKSNSLVLYKQRPARVLRVDDRLEIELETGATMRVRPKDIELLHPGPFGSFDDLQAGEGELHVAWEILAGERTTLPELSELVYGAFTPASAWTTWNHVVEGTFFEGRPEDIYARTVEEVERRRQEREQAEASQRAWKGFMNRARKGEYDPADKAFIRDVENLALGRGERAHVLRELGRAETPESAHALLLQLGVWDPYVNPYPVRLNLPLHQPDLPVPWLPEEPRLDLTHLPAFAIDDEGTSTPDDALSFDGERLWVHVADVSALVLPDSPIDQEARARASSLHLPEETLHLLPWPITEQLGLGLQDISPALSFGLEVAENGEVTGFQVAPSWVRVTRLSYRAADFMMNEEPFASIEALMNAARLVRQARGAVMIDFPEVKITVRDRVIDIELLPPLRSRSMVEEAMILTSAETARYAAANGIPVPYSQQDPVESDERPETLSGMFAFRRLLKRSRYRVSVGPHSGLGVAAYTQATSPLRRYLDLVVHQQLRAYHQGRPVLVESQLLERIGAVEAVLGDLRRAEILSERHWTLVYLLQNPGWNGEAVLVEKRGSTGILIIPALSWETRVYLKHDLPLDARIQLALNEVDLPVLDASFRIL